MWKATYYRSASFAAFVVGSTLALLTGAQADTLTFNQTIGQCCGVEIGAVGNPAVPGQGLLVTSMLPVTQNLNVAFDGLPGR